MEFVWAIAQNPPNEVSVRTNGNVIYSGCILLLIQWIPFVISKKGNKYLVYDTVSHIENNTENNIIYPPTFVIVSNPFIMQLSNKLKSKNRDYLISIPFFI